MQQYHRTCDEVIQRYAGFVPQHLGDGVLVYFGYPTAHEDDAQRAVRAGVEIIQALQSRARQQAVRAPLPYGRGSDALPVRIGIHTGLVVVGEIGAPGRTEQLALGETPNLAARIQGLAEPNTVMVSAATQRLVNDTFECQPFGSHLVKGLDTPIAVYHVQSERQQVSPLAGRSTLTPLVGREQEVGLLLDRWEQVKEGQGQVVLLSGEPGIGKSRLAYRLREQVTTEGSLLFEARCSPYHQQSALYPLIDLWQRTLLFNRHDTDAEKIAKLERTLALYELPDALPLFTSLLSLPTPSQYPALNLTPQKQKERTLQALLQLLMAQAERQATVLVWEDVHWADPSSLEFLTLLTDQLPTTKLLLVLTFRPEFVPPWPPRSHLSHLVLNRLGHKHVETMIEKAAAGHDLPTEVIEQIRLKTDGVSLFVEELTKSVVEHLGEQAAGAGQQKGQPRAVVGIPATLQDALMARLDRLAEARPIAQLGATLGREFSYELLHAVSPDNDTPLQTALSKLVEAEILYQRGIGEQARYFFKHALIQDTAYQSLLKSTRQQYHTQIAKVLEERFPDIKANQPEVLAHHYTEASLTQQAILYWQQAGQRVLQRSAYKEAIIHLTKGLELLKTLPDTAERAQQELTLQLALSAALSTVKGYTAPEVEKAVTRARELCQQLGENRQLFPVLYRLWVFYLIRREFQTTHELAEQMLHLAQSVQDSYLLSLAHGTLGGALCHLGELPLARTHLEQAIALHDPQLRPSTPIGMTDSQVLCLSFASWTLWDLGYPDQALKRSHEALALAEKLSHSFSLAYALGFATWLHLFRREGATAQEQAEAVMRLSTEQGFPSWLALGALARGCALIEQGQVQEGMADLHQSQTPFPLALLAGAYGKVGQVEEGLAILAKALDLENSSGEHVNEAELYRLKGELTLQKEFHVQGSTFQVASPQSAFRTPQSEMEAEACFLKAIDIAQKQQAKSWELRSSTSLARLWQQQGKTAEARNLLSNVYNWFTEGFDTKDLQEAKALLDELSD